MTKVQALNDMKFGRLTVVKLSNKRLHDRVSWECICECGNKCIKTGHDLKSGKTMSCGCLRKDTARKTLTRHGFKRTRFYNIWCGVKSRCNNKNNPAYNDYGGRGITICKEWSKFENFRDDMYKIYIEHCSKFGENNTSIDRKDNEMGYCKENCRWATNKEQSNNQRARRDTKLIKFISPSNDVYFCKNISCFCRKFNLTRGSIYKVINGEWRKHKGWFAEEIRTFINKRG